MRHGRVLPIRRSLLRSMSSAQTVSKVHANYELACLILGDYELRGMSIAEIAKERKITYSHVYMIVNGVNHKTAKAK